MKQYSVLYDGMSIEFTGYFKTVSAVRKYLKQRYSDCTKITFQAVYPVVEKEIYKV